MGRHFIVSQLFKNEGQTIVKQLGNLIRKIWKEETRHIRYYRTSY